MSSDNRGINIHYTHFEQITDIYIYIYIDIEISRDIQKLLTRNYYR